MSIANLLTNNVKSSQNLNINNMDLSGVFITEAISFSRNFDITILNNGSIRIGNLVDLSLDLTITIATSPGVAVSLGTLSTNFLPLQDTLIICPDITSPSSGIFNIATNGSLTYTPLTITTPNPITISCNITYISA